jgi:hypothetical protein
MPTEHPELTSPQPRPAPDAEQLSAVNDVLEHLLDPLEDVDPSRGAASSDEAASAESWPPVVPIILPYEDRSAIREFLARLRWSERDRFRIPRSLARWTLFAAAFWGVVWFIFSLAALR